MEKEEQSIDPLHEAALLASESAKPSSSPEYWAKRSCNNCYGRGVVGTITHTVGKNNKITNELLCHCAQNNFTKWRTNYIRHWIIASKINSNVDNV